VEARGFGGEDEKFNGRMVLRIRRLYNLYKRIKIMTALKEPHHQNLKSSTRLRQEV